MADKKQTPRPKVKCFHITLSDEQHAAITRAATERYISPTVYARLVLTGVMPSPLARPQD